MTQWLIYAIVGSFAGLFAGLLGVGGGLIIVPALVMVFEIQQLHPAHITQIAVGTSLATIVITGLSSVWAHQKRAAISWPTVWKLTGGIVPGALLGAIAADSLGSFWLEKIIGVFALLAALKMSAGWTPKAQHRSPPPSELLMAGGMIGSISSMIGIGGGTLTVPYLLWSKIPMRQAVAISAACGVPIALAGAASFALVGWGKADLPAQSFGYIYWPAWLGIVITSIFFAQLGAHLAHTLPVSLIKRIFSGLLAVIGIKMLLF